MKVVSGLSLATVLMMIALHGNADSSVSECLHDEVEAHVRQQFAIYGPRSAGHEYFGFIYLRDGEIASAVTRSRGCATVIKCAVDSSEAIRSMPRPAQVLGEWHSHPHGGSASLSREDVRGAYSNRHISCYLAFYSTPAGEIYAWNAHQISVPIAMASRTQIGNYRMESDYPPFRFTSTLTSSHRELASSAIDRQAMRACQGKAAGLDCLHEQPFAGHAPRRDVDHHVAALTGVGPDQLRIRRDE
jgi:hypothetical protein